MVALATGFATHIPLVLPTASLLWSCRLRARPW
jgi:hypothetical protein